MKAGNPLIDADELDLMEMQGVVHGHPAKSGTTACVTIVTDHRIICANSGDSRAVLCKRYPDTSKTLEQRLGAESVTGEDGEFTTPGRRRMMSEEVVVREEAKESPHLYHHSPLRRNQPKVTTPGSKVPNTTSLLRKRISSPTMPAKTIKRQSSDPHISRLRKKMTDSQAITRASTPSGVDLGLPVSQTMGLEVPPLPGAKLSSTSVNSESDETLFDDVKLCKCRKGCVCKKKNAAEGCKCKMGASCKCDVYILQTPPKESSILLDLVTKPLRGRAVSRLSNGSDLKALSFEGSADAGKLDNANDEKASRPSFPPVMPEHIEKMTLKQAEAEKVKLIETSLYDLEQIARKRGVDKQVIFDEHADELRHVMRHVRELRQEKAAMKAELQNGVGPAFDDTAAPVSPNSQRAVADKNTAGVAKVKAADIRMMRRVDTMADIPDSGDMSVVQTGDFSGGEALVEDVDLDEPESPVTPVKTESAMKALVKKRPPLVRKLKVMNHEAWELPPIWRLAAAEIGPLSSNLIVTPGHAAESLRVIPLSFDHKPQLSVEQARIEAAGYNVQLDMLGNYRINQGLNVSRGLGDFFYKHPDLPVDKQAVSPIPDVSILHRNVDDDLFILMGSDGIFEKNSHLSACQQVGIHALTADRDPTSPSRKIRPWTVPDNIEEGIKNLLEKSLCSVSDRRSRIPRVRTCGVDNMTALVVDVSKKMSYSGGKPRRWKRGLEKDIVDVGQLLRI